MDPLQQYLPKKETPPQPNKENFIVETIKFVVLALIIVLPIRYFVAQPFVVSGSSMDPTFQNGQYLIVDELSYRFKDPHRGDVVVFTPPVDADKYYIKRIIGLPGETVRVEGSDVVIKNKNHPDGFKLDQSYVAEPNEKIDSISFTLLNDQYFVMGDNRAASSDSRVWGPITKESIVGQPAARLFPIQTLGVYPGKFPYTN